MKWKDVTEKEIKHIRVKDCSCCKNSIKISSLESGCDYLARHGKRRPCKPGECRMAGAFEPKRRK